MFGRKARQSARDARAQLLAELYAQWSQFERDGDTERAALRLRQAGVLGSLPLDLVPAYVEQFERDA